MKIVTNNVARRMMSLVELLPKAQVAFDYIDPHGDEALTPRFVVYKGNLYDAFDSQTILAAENHTAPVGWAMYVTPSDPFAKWDSIVSETYFSGVVFRFPRDSDDSVVVGTYFA